MSDLLQISAKVLGVIALSTMHHNTAGFGMDFAAHLLLVELKVDSILVDTGEIR
jgi:hypothetical protein